MKLLIYGVKDNVEGGFVFFFQAVNEGIMKRQVESALLSKEPNVFSRNLKDKSIYELGEVNTDNGVIKPHDALFIIDIAEIRLDLIRQIKLAKQEAGEEKPEASEVVSDEQ